MGDEAVDLTMNNESRLSVRKSSGVPLFVDAVTKEPVLSSGKILARDVSVTRTESVAASSSFKAAG
jgi:hypothetical protein